MDDFVRRRADGTTLSDAAATEALDVAAPMRSAPNPVVSPVRAFALDLDLDDDAGPLDGPSGPIFESGGPAFDVDLFKENLRDALAGNCAGYAFAINQGGKLARTGAGWFKQYADNPADNLDMGTKARMHVASVAKTLTATCVLKALHDRGLTVEAKVKDFLPSQWTVPGQLDYLTFKHVLAHRSGFSRNATLPSYDSVRSMVENMEDWTFDSATHPEFGNFAFGYDNRNYGLMRIALPYIACPQVMTGVEAQGWGDGDYHGAVDRATQDNYRFLMQHYVFNPLGLTGIRTRPDQTNPNRVMFYRFPNPNWTEAQDGGDKAWLAGGEGWVMSVRHLAKFLRFRRYSDAFLPAGLRAEMDDKRLGWLTAAGDHGTYLRHGGAYGGRRADGTVDLGSGPMRGTIMEFPYGVEVAVLVNSFYIDVDGSLDGAVKDAFDASFA